MFGRQRGAGPVRRLRRAVQTLQSSRSQTCKASALGRRLRQSGCGPPGSLRGDVTGPRALLSARGRAHTGESAAGAPGESLTWANLGFSTRNTRTPGPVVRPGDDGGRSWAGFLALGSARPSGWPPAPLVTYWTGRASSAKGTGPRTLLLTPRRTRLSAWCVSSPPGPWRSWLERGFPWKHGSQTTWSAQNHQEQNPLKYSRRKYA